MLNQRLQQKLLQKLSPQQIQLMKLLQIPTANLEQRIKEEIEENPILEDGTIDYSDSESEITNDIHEYDDDDDFKEPDDVYEQSSDIDVSDYLNDEDPYYKTESNNYSADDKKEIPFIAGPTFQDHLISQLGLTLLSEKHYQMALYIIGNIDDDGYLRRDLEPMVYDLAFTQNIQTTKEELEEVLSVVQDFEPSGVGGRDLRECLLIQIRKANQKERSVANATLILENYFEEFTKKHYDKIQKKLGISDVELKAAIEEILKLNPKPGNSFAGSHRAAEIVIPDFTLNYSEGQFELLLNSRNAPLLRISPRYTEMLDKYNTHKDTATSKDKETILFVKQKLDSAKWFIDAIKQRQETLMAVMGAILDYQKEFFVDGDETKLKPMILKDIAEKVGLDISTVSRVANSKYVETHFGIYPLKYFFSESLSTDDGEEVSTREVKKILKDCIENEDKRRPLTDEKLCEILKEKGYNIARRTVAKYREQLDIPVARLRKEL